MSDLPIITDPLTQNLTPIGVLDSGETIGLSPEDRVGNMLFLGGAGSGKSVAVANMTISDIVHGKGGLMIDPYGDIADMILEHVPEERKSKVAAFDLIEGDLESNITQFEAEFDLNEMKKDDGKFLLIKLHSRTLDKDTIRSFGQYVTEKFYSIVGADGDISNRTLVLDEGQNFFTDKTLPHILKNKDYGLSCLISGQTTANFTPEALEKLLPAIDHVICGANLDENTTKVLTKQFDMGVTAEDIIQLEKFTYLAYLKLADEFQPAVRVKGVYPINFPKTA